MTNKFVKVVLSLIMGVILITGMLGCTSQTTPTPEPTPTTPTPEATTRTITDIANRAVTVPIDIERVVCLHPIPDYMVWRLAQDKLVSISRVFDLGLKNGSIGLFADSEFQELEALTIVPCFFDAIDPEELLALQPDVIVDMTKDPNLESLQSTLGVPIFAISKDTLNDYEASFRLMGELLGNEEEGNELADYWHNSIERVTDVTSQIPQNERLKVYYASHDGPLSTVGSATVMASIINLAGGVDYASANTGLITQTGNTDEHATVSLEQVLLWNPDVIITKTANERDTIISSSQWADVSAVKNNRVYCCLRYESMDGLSSLVGLGWATNKLYPDKFTFDIIQESRTFYSLFYLYDSMTESQILQEQNDTY